VSTIEKPKASCHNEPFFIHHKKNKKPSAKPLILLSTKWGGRDLTTYSKALHPIIAVSF